MKSFLIGLLLMSLPTFASVIGISTHPLNERAKVLSAEITGYMSQRHEMGMGLRYTHELNRDKMIDFSASGGQDSRSFMGGAGMDISLLREDIYQPRVSLKPYVQYTKFEDSKESIMGLAPSMRKGLSLAGEEFFPYLALPAGIKLNNESNEFVYYASLTIGASTRFPWANSDQLLLSLEGNKDMGASSDYLGVLVSWVWN